MYGCRSRPDPVLRPPAAAHDPAAARRPAVPAPRSLAIAAAPPHEVAEAALMCGVSLRIAPAPSRRHELRRTRPRPLPRQTRDPRAGEEMLTAAADNFTTGEKWPALVLRRTADRYGFTLFHKGKARRVPSVGPGRPGHRPRRGHRHRAGPRRRLPGAGPAPAGHPAARHEQPGPAPVRAGGRTRTAPAPGRLRRTRRDPGRPAGAQLLARRGVFKGIRDTMSTDLGTPGPAVPRPQRWWVLRIVGLMILVPAAVYAWWSRT